MALDFSSLQKAVHSLERALKVALTVINGKINNDYEEVIRAGVIKNFEFTYELCWKFIKRWLEVNGEGAAVDGATRKELFRLAAEHRLIEDVESWFRYAGARNLTSHTYDNRTADDVFESAKIFVSDAGSLLQNLENKND